MPTLNLGILAHVDAGKTTLTERLLYAAGVIDEIGSVDAGTTQTDSMPLERARGITIRAAVVAFTIDGLTVNIIDTPGHPDFIAEVDRSLSVLDGAVLVVSAVEGVQAQTLVLLRALERLAVPTIIFVNKIDRRGADSDRVLGAIRERLGTDYPVLFGSAATGAGIDRLLAALPGLLPTSRAETEGATSGRVFKIERGRKNEKVAYVRMFSGSLCVRERVQFGADGEGTVTALEVFEHGAAVRRPSVEAGQIAKVFGLREIRVGDDVGSPRAGAAASFAPPPFETAVVPRDAAERGALHAALARLAEQDPLINVRQDDVRQELFVSLYGEVQKEVIQQTLAADFGLEVDFLETTTVCVERTVGAAAAVERLGEPGNPFLATVGLRVEPAPAGGGIHFALDVDLITIPLFIYKTVDAFRSSMEDYVRLTLREGLYGWEVADCSVTMTESNYTSPASTAGAFRKLTPLVLMDALGRAGTAVCEPIHRFRLDVPAATLSAVLRLLAGLRAIPRPPAVSGAWCAIEGEIPAATVSRVQRQLHGCTGGEGVFESTFERCAPVAGPAPSRGRADGHPLNRKEYLLRLSGRA